MKVQRLLAVVSGALISTLASVVSAQTTIFSDNFDSLDGTAALVGNDWLFQKITFQDAGCVTFDGVYAYTQVDPQAAQNQNYSTVKPAGGGAGTIYDVYSGASLESADNLIGGTLSLGVREDNYAAYDPTGKSPCHQSRVFKNTSSATGGLKTGTYKITAKTKFSAYGTDTTNGTGSKTGVWLTAYDVANGYSILFSEYRDNSIARADGTVTVSEEFSVDVGTVTNVLISAGFYSQVNADTSAFAIWDDVALTYTAPTSGGGGGGGGAVGGGDPNAIPVLPLGGLLGLIGLIGLMGLRRKF